MRKREKGFTLVEIIVVLVILAILAVVAIPTMIGYVDRAKEAEIYQDIRMVRTAFDTSLVWAAGEDKYSDLINKDGQLFVHSLEVTGEADKELMKAFEMHMDELLRDDLKAKSYSLTAVPLNKDSTANNFIIYMHLTYDRNGKDVKYSWSSETGELQKN